MYNKLIEISKEQVITLFGGQFLNCSIKEEYYTKHPEYEYTNNGICTYERYMLVHRFKSQENDYLLFKSWENEEDIPREDAMYDKSDKVENVIFKDSECKYYLKYFSTMNLLDLVIVAIDDSKETDQKIEYEISFMECVV